MICSDRGVLLGDALRFPSHHLFCLKSGDRVSEQTG